MICIPNAPKYSLTGCLETKALLTQYKAQALSQGKLNLTQFMPHGYFEILKDFHLINVKLSMKKLGLRSNPGGYDDVMMIVDDQSGKR